ncbi:MAG: MarC family protein [Hyphomicrobiales bacterium]|nr:MarC family protein [Hyphomicrobiales bacterium]
MTPTWTELFLLLLVGLGPLKTMLVYVEKTENYDQPTRDKVAIYAVITAICLAISLLFLGAGLQSLLHFSIGALSVSGGLILLLFSLRIVLDTGGDDGDQSEDTDPVSLAISPIALPLLLNPVGIVALVTFSAEAQSMEVYLRILAVVLCLGVIDVAVLLLAGRLGKLIPHPIIELLERMFSILICALAVQIMVDGLEDLKIL